MLLLCLFFTQKRTGTVNWIQGLTDRRLMMKSRGGMSHLLKYSRFQDLINFAPQNKQTHIIVERMMPNLYMNTL